MSVYQKFLKNATNEKDVPTNWTAYLLNDLYRSSLWSGSKNGLKINKQLFLDGAQRLGNTSPISETDMVQLIL